jgi:hypothetical protein
MNFYNGNNDLRVFQGIPKVEYTTWMMHYRFGALIRLETSNHYINIAIL